MSIEELKRVLKEKGISPSLYNLDMKGRDDERLCLVSENGKWVVYYAERGIRTTEKSFDAEDEACRYMLNRFSL